MRIESSTTIKGAENRIKHTKGSGLIDPQGILQNFQSNNWIEGL
jgi:hypothetical protein